MIILYTLTNCGICEVMKKKMNAKNLIYIEKKDDEDIVKKGYDHFPILELENGDILNSPMEINKWITAQ